MVQIFLPGDYVVNFIKQNQGKAISQDDMCLLLISRVNAQQGNKHPHCTPQMGRIWRPIQAEKPDLDTEDDERSEVESQPRESVDKRGIHSLTEIWILKGK
jgi:hypothetical protein